MRSRFLEYSTWAPIDFSSLATLVQNGLFIFYRGFNSLRLRQRRDINCHHRLLSLTDTSTRPTDKYEVKVHPQTASYPWCRHHETVIHATNDQSNCFTSTRREWEGWVEAGQKLNRPVLVQSPDFNLLRSVRPARPQAANGADGYPTPYQPPVVAVAKSAKQEIHKAFKWHYFKEGLIFVLRVGRSLIFYSLYTRAYAWLLGLTSDFLGGFPSPFP